MMIDNIIALYEKVYLQLRNLLKMGFHNRPHPDLFSNFAHVMVLSSAS